MIIWFSGTGNTHQFAEEVAEATGDELVSMNARLRAHDTSELHSDAPFVVCAPIYYGRIPGPVEENLRKSELSGNEQIYFCSTCYQTPYAAQSRLERLTADKGMKFMGLAAALMPQSYIVMYEPPSAEDGAKTIDAALPEMRKAARSIAAGERLPRTAGAGALMTNVVNPFAYTGALVKAGPFSTTQGCTGCGTCGRLCPLGNISLQDGRPAWGGDCIHCMACISGCPRHAIEYGKKTAGRNRWWNPTYTLSEAQA